MKISRKFFAIGWLIMSLGLLSACGNKVSEAIVTVKQAEPANMVSQTVELATAEPAKVTVSIKQEPETVEADVTDDIDEETPAPPEEAPVSDEPASSNEEPKTPQPSSGKQVSEVHARLIRENQLLEKKRLDFEDKIKQSANTTSKEALESLTNHPSRNEVDFTQEDWLWPVPTATQITSPFGKREHPILKTPNLHNGIDIASPEGTPIVAAKSGLVVASLEDKEISGKYVMILHLDGYYSLYAHNSSLVVEEGQFVSIGEVVAYMGSTGQSTGSHLHFSILKQGEFLDPQDFVSFSE